MEMLAGYFGGGSGSAENVVSIYEMVTGEQAFPGESIASVLAAIMRDEPERVSELLPTVPAGLEEVIERALVKKREERFQTMEELRDALEEVKEGRARRPVHSQIVRIGDFEVDLEAAELRKQNRKLKLQGKPFEILAILLERPGRVVSREELFKRLWPSDTFVDFDNSVNAAINKLRTALGDAADKPRYVETVPRRGYRFIGPVQFADGSESAALEPADVPELARVQVPRPFRKYAVWIGGALLVVAMATVAMRLYLSSPDSPAPMPRTRPLTSFEGAEFDPALSPDGNQVAFMWDGGEPGGTPQLYVKMIDGTDTLQLTDGVQAVIQPVWSPDGRQIAFLRGENWAPRQEIFVVSGLGGKERRVGEITTAQALRQRMSWSTDGESLAIVGQSQESSESIFFLSLETGARRRLTSPPSGHYDSSPKFSPDGETIAFVRSRTPALGKADIYRMPASGGKETRLTFDKHVWALDWTPDSREVIYSAFDSFGQTSLWSVSRDGGEPQRLPFGANANMVSIARTANLLAYAQSNLQLNLWRVGGPTADPPTPPERLIASTYWDIQPRFSPDGKRLAFSTSRSGEVEVWTCDGSGEDCGRLSDGWQPAWSPDGAQIAFTAFIGENQTGGAAIHLVEAAGGFPRRLTQSGDGQLPSWSQDGRFVYFGSRRSGRQEIWKIAADGGGAQQVTHNGGVTAFESEDGRFVYFARHPSPRRNKIWKVPVEGGEETLVLDEEPDFQDWVLWGENLVYFNPEGKNGPAIEVLDLDKNEVREVVPLPNRRPWGGGLNTGLTVSPDGQWVVYTQLDGVSSDLMLVENFR